ncbi:MULTISPECIES: putative selenate reductase subunit YgfK [Tenebrionibacter/Tenebrionicola group]|jgi:putative selenate reductase|uniref:Selenate reductase subunit YgfK n=2 Tax=Tenebrionibacter/Tenebrionicola group TaxID=2969848 RepID=A0A949V3V7_9ENTR|nr:MULTISPECIES: putative selenate reductase subunit YgfK [Tenebrionibacter/Tenebrionicola group]MBK4714830.1 putative selenate reductase subunit YgfK [Tenebrionibacter intestinalis]MBV4414069.1 putative selenate reductase subunit YgfK [Tenebrionicola larvae]MBV5095611.1 putative selenate reductase subunit YgfK [Tenebrionicola larvae]
MSDIMRPVPFSELLTRICAEYEENRSIFGIPESEFYQRDPARQLRLFGETCDTPVGPAAGPHTQLAPNIIVAWLTGGSFIELKTVQILDRLELEKPCIDPSDEAYNTEWSTELTLEKAWDEYLKAWMALWLLETLLSPRSSAHGRSFIFNMSVGYDLKGITEPRMQTFIDETMDASKNAKFNRYRQELAQFIARGGWSLLAKGDARALSELPESISPRMVRSVTLSTMHGCPPDEIESICRYMLTEKGLHTYVKLNPTLLGYARVREILDNNGFDYIQLSEESFGHDLQLAQALDMLERLMTLGVEKGLAFGVKLTNTLGARNHKGRLPGDEMYMSGRALFPLSINVAALLSRHFDGRLPISYSGGASQYNIAAIFATGIKPITMATDLLKPGGYLRMAKSTRMLEEVADWGRRHIDVAALDQLAKRALNADWAQKEWKSKDEIDTGEALPLTDCYVAPCVTACAIKQDIPEYLRLAGAGRYADALSLIYERNALPSITGHICDHQCQYNCTRLDYDSALNIRAIKKIAREKGWEEYRRRWHRPAGSGDRHPVAVIGAGPAGLAAGYFLARAGHPVTLFEREANAGGVVRNIVPRFRIPAELVQQDIDFIAEHGVKFVYNCDPDLTIDSLKQQGFHYICIGTGATKNNALRLAGDNANVWRSFEFLRAFNSKAPPALRGEVAIVGAGNTAMDCARAALRLPEVTGATIVYRRDRDAMPAWPEEIAEAEHDGVRFMTLVNPEQYDADGQLHLRVMQLGEPDEGGRRRPVATQEIRKTHFDALITATGENPDEQALRRIGLPVGDSGVPTVDARTLETERPNVFLIGDVQSGPASIVGAIGGARKACDAILKRENKPAPAPSRALNTDPQEVYTRKGIIAVQQVNSDAPDAFARQEAERCLSCNYICSKCVDVCPNRANVALAVPGFRSRHQILHLDALCNECGNCAQFCPWQGKPYHDKVTVFSLEQDFERSNNPGFLLNGKQIRIRQDGRTWQLALNGDGQIVDLPQELTEMNQIINYTRQHHAYLLGAVEE